MAKPTVDTAWARNLVAISVLDQNGNSGLVFNRKEPTNQYKDTGLQPNVPVIGDLLNYKLWADHLMLEWLRQSEVGTVLEFADGTMTKAQLEADRGGTWSDLGTEARTYSGGIVTVRGFRKTA